MAARRKKRRAAATPRRPNQSRPGWIVLLLGMIVGVVVTLVFQSVDPWTRLAERSSASGDAVPGKVSARAGDVGNTKPTMPRFQFYTQLPEMEVVVPESELRLESTANPPATRVTQKRQPAAKNSGQEAARAPSSSTSASASVKETLPAVAQSRYTLQIGSFSKAEDAEQLKANVTLLGLSAHIQTVQINGSDTWHRVRAGPFSSLAEVNEARGRLRANQLDAIVLKNR